MTDANLKVLDSDEVPVYQKGYQAFTIGDPGILVRVGPIGEPAHVTGATADAYGTAALTWTSKLYSKKKIVIINTGGSNSLTFKAEGVAESGSSYPHSINDDCGLDTEQALVAGDWLTLDIQDWWPEINVYIKSTVGGSSTNFRIEYGAGQ